jgi:signal transduction histidine kinase
MFKNFRTSTKLLVLCATFMISISLPIYGLVKEKNIAIDFARKELSGSQYLATVREIYAAILAVNGEFPPGPGASNRAVLATLADAELQVRGQLQTGELSQALARSLRQLGPGGASDAQIDALVVEALDRAQTLAWRIGDDSNLALDPDLDSYYVQNIVVHLLPALVSRLAELQEYFARNLRAGRQSVVRDIGAPMSLLRSTGNDVKSNLDAAYRGNPDGRLKRAVDGRFAAMMSSVDSYLGALGVSAEGVDARDEVSYGQFHRRTMQDVIAAWTVAQAELDRLLQQRIRSLLNRMWVDLALVAAFAGLSIFVAMLTHRHIVGPLARLEAVALTVRQSKDYNLRAEYNSRDEIGRVATAFDDMLSELAAARKREAAERAEFARVTRLTTMGEMAASIAHEVNQPLAAIVTNGNAGLRWLANATPDLNKVNAVLQRVVRDGLRASEVIGSIRAIFKKGPLERAPVHIAQLVEEVVALLQGEFLSAQVVPEVDAAPGSSALVDRVQLQQVLLNLMTNAIDAMRATQDRPRRLQIRVGVGEGNGVRVAVQDCGSGIDPTDTDRIFEPFFTTKSGGMGLGLSICRSIIEAHGGRLWASPGAPHGAVFEFTLPGCNDGGP